MGPMARAPRRRRAAWGAATVATAIALTAAGCGEEEETGLSKQELKTQASTICERHFNKITAEANKVLAGGQLPDPRKFGQLAQGTIIPELTQQTRELRALEPQDEIADEYNAFLDASGAAIERIKQDPRLITDASNFKDVNQQAEEAGLPMECKIGPSG